MSDMVGNPKDGFSRFTAKMISLVYDALINFSHVDFSI